MKNQFGPKFYFVHDHLLKIVEGRPLIKFHPSIPYQNNKLKTKFGTFWGGALQFGLFNTSTTIPSLKVCVYPSCDDLFKTKKEAEKKLKSIFEGINKNIDGQIASLQEDKRVIDREIRELKRNKVTLQ